MLVMGQCIACTYYFSLGAGDLRISYPCFCATYTAAMFAASTTMACVQTRASFSVSIAIA
ncbi:hypothetical protein GQ600_14484 [Phytophthora cactorum]|nr:hypothetical protein GQ600_14484 [Phytophthora cactorum]